jgi:hypothetical protein
MKSQNMKRFARGGNDMKQRVAEENFVRAIADFNQVLKLNPNDTDAGENIEHVRQMWRDAGIDKPAP